MRFMIDTKTGAIYLEAENFVIRPSLTREEFLASPLGKVSGIYVKNEPHCSFSTGILKIMGDSFYITLFFLGSALFEIDFVTTEAGFGPSWAEWSEEKELQRKRFHDSWLNKVLGNDRYPYDYKWGSVRSFYDQKGGLVGWPFQYREQVWAA
jgi:hypothetical protein